MRCTQSSSRHVSVLIVGRWACAAMVFASSSALSAACSPGADVEGSLPVSSAPSTKHGTTTNPSGDSNGEGSSGNGVLVENQGGGGADSNSQNGVSSDSDAGPTEGNDGGAHVGPCANVPAASNGKYCGASQQSGFAGGNSTTLFTCKDGASSFVLCGGGCIVAPAGQDDHCGTGVITPCANVPAANNGTYCGGSKESGFTGGDADTLYTCHNGEATATHCAGGCTLAAAGTPDTCK